MWSLVMGALVSSEDEGQGEVVGNTSHVDTTQPEIIDKESAILQQEDISLTVQEHAAAANNDSTDNPSRISANDNGAETSNRASNLSRREEGDGMEKPILVKTPSEIFKSTTLVLPETGVSLDNIPPIADKVDLSPVIPTSALVKQKAKVYPKGTYPPAVKKAKEAKFVPCEPYKGAVSPIISAGSKALKIREKCAPVPQLDLEKSITPTKTCAPSDTDVTTEEEHVDGGDAPANDASVGQFIDEKMNPLLEANYRAMLLAKEKELDRLRLALTDAEKQLRIQSQVNGELKSLLVASVGEDIEARLDFLTQDKARLAADVVHYNNKISRDWEEKEALHVESDIWRSKFLASTVILEELTRTKQSLETRTHQLEHTARRMIIERKDFAAKLNVAESMLRCAVPAPPHQSADESPSAAGPGQVHVGTHDGGSKEPRLQQQHKDLNGLCTSIEAYTKRICDKLAGDKMGVRYTPATEPQYYATQSEQEMEHLLAESVHTGHSDLPEEASCRLTRGARTLLIKMGDQAQSPGKSAFNACSHCNGTVETV
eukprot:TRINITY_DN7332_c0_g1_i1.p1 TRINITY_DN7332_c0_g1~~TRINITY_DN7332_c0_g1_i1.p1  ORF type:complete len:545 (+),score=166.98 TRINITY_DN7332_c0_g1_i1:126-1760(+)